MAAGAMEMQQQGKNGRIVGMKALRASALGVFFMKYVLAVSSGHVDFLCRNVCLISLHEMHRP
jgi:hypothetical protein